MKQLYSTVYNSVLHLISPPVCLFCSRFITTRRALCDECYDRIQPVVSQGLLINSHQTITVHALSSYTDPLRSLILTKHHGNRAVSKQLGALVWQASLIQAHSFDIIVPIPLHWMRYARRGYNQAESMAEEIARLSGKPLVHALKRNRITSFQCGLSKEARKENLNHAFELSCASVELNGKNILLIDDLMTTGSTLIEAGKAFLALKPASLQALVVCRVI